MVEGEEVKEMGKSGRPIGVTIIGIIQIIESMTAFIAGIYILYLLYFPNTIRPIGAVFGIIIFGYGSIAIGIISLLLGVGVLEGWIWIWYFELTSLILALIPIVLFGLGFSQYYTVMGIVADVGGLLYFFKKNVRDYFDI